MIPDEIDIYGTANLLIDQHGKDAPTFATMQAEKRAEARDMDGKAVRLRMLKAIKEVLDKNPPGAALSALEHKRGETPWGKA